jgi:phytoene dehydrogenase-like protein
MGNGAEVAVVGAGHNGLVCAAYLAQAGINVLVLEARAVIGGTAGTVDAAGARANICNCEHVMFRSSPIAEELELASHGLRYLDVEPAMMNLSWDTSPPWFVFHDVQRTLESVSLAFPRDLEGYRRYLRDALPAARLLLRIGNAMPWRRTIARAAMADAPASRTLLRLQRASALDVLRGYFTEDALISPALVAGPVSWGLSPAAPGTGLGALMYALKHLVMTGRPAGGSGGLAAALRRAIERAGGRVRCDAKVRHVVLDGARVRGVELEGGETVAAPVVIAAGDPRTTFVSWLRDVPAGAQALVERWRRAEGLPGYESKVDVVVARAPRYRAVVDAHLERLDIDDALIPTAMIGPPAAEIVAAHRRMAQGRVADRLMHYVNVPTALDPDFWPDEARHVLSLECLYTPYALEGGWPGSPEPRRWLTSFAGLLEPGFLDGVQTWRAVTPDAYEAEFHLPRGTPPAYALAPLDLLLGRRRELIRYRTPIDGLLVTGAGTFPGAGVWGASGRNAASVVIADRRPVSRARRGSARG